MATRTVGDTGTASNNVTNEVALHGSIASAEAACVNGDTIQVIRNADVQSTAMEIDKEITLTAHAGCAVNDPSYAHASGRARASGAIDIYANNVTIEKLGFFGNPCIRDNGYTGVTIRNCFLKTSGATCISTSGTVTLVNLAIVGGTGEVIPIYGGTLNCYHVSMYIQPAGTGYRGFANYGGTFNCYACVALRGGDGSNFHGTIGGDFNVSEDTSAPGSSSTKYARSESYSNWFTNTGSNTEDLALAAARQGWWAANKDAIDQTGWPSDVSTDIAGTTRSSNIDPGVWQTPAASSGGHVPYNRVRSFLHLLRR